MGVAIRFLRMNLMVLKAGKCCSVFHILHVSRHRVGGRLFSVSCCLHLKAPPRNNRKATVDIPGLERVTYAERLHFVPGLAKPTFPQWSRGWRDPHRYSGPEYKGLPPRAEKPCFVFNQRTSALEGTVLPGQENISSIYNRDGNTVPIPSPDKQYG